MRCSRSYYLDRLLRYSYNLADCRQHDLCDGNAILKGKIHDDYCLARYTELGGRLLDRLSLLSVFGNSE